MGDAFRQAARDRPSPAPDARAPLRAARLVHAQAAVLPLALSSSIAFGVDDVGLLLAAGTGAVVGTLGDARGFPVAFGVIAAICLAAIFAIRSIRAGGRGGS